MKKLQLIFIFLLFSSIFHNDLVKNKKLVNTLRVRKYYYASPFNNKKIMKIDTFRIINIENKKCYLMNDDGETFEAPLNWMLLNTQPL